MTDTPPTTEQTEVEPVEVEEVETPSFVADFPRVDTDAWRELVAQVVNRRRPEDRRLDPDAAVDSLRTTLDGLTVEPLYVPDEDARPLGRPGVMPFVRGRTALRDRPAWDVRQLHDDPDVRATRAAVAADLEHGVTSLWLVAGADGVAPASLADVLADVDLSAVPVAVTTLDDQEVAAEALVAVWSDRGVGADVAGSLGLDPLGRAAVRGGTPDLEPLRTWAGRVAERYPDVAVATADSRPYHDAGGGAVEELGAAVATGLAYVRELVEGGTGVADAFGLVDFRLAVDDDQFLSIAKLRVLRRLWARVAEVCEVPEEKRGARTHAVTSRRMTSRDDPYVNILRSTIACFGAAVGGADAVTVLPFDDALGLPEEFSRRVARNTHALLAEESSIARVVDPAGGSFYVESLTDSLAEAAWAWFQRIEAAGGMARALRDGVVHARLDEVRAEVDARLATRTRPLTGVSTFPSLADRPLDRTARATLPGLPGDVDALPCRRDAEVYERLRDRSRAAGERGAVPTVLLACLGTRRDHGARETFTSAFLAAGGIAGDLVEIDEADEVPADHDIAVVCASPALNGERGADAVRRLREAGVARVYLAGRRGELGDDADLVDGEIGVGADAVAVLTDLLDRLGAPATDPLPDSADPTPEGTGA